MTDAVCTATRTLTLAAPRALTLAALAVALLAALLAPAPTAQAQTRDPVDLELSITNRDLNVEAGGTFVATVRNNSETVVRDIRVQFEVEDITRRKTTILREERIPDVRNFGQVNYDTLEWTIPELSPGIGAVTRLTIDHAKTDFVGATVENPSLLRFQGEIADFTPREHPENFGNNRARTFVTVIHHQGSTLMNVLFGFNLSYGVDADPSTSSFTVRVANPGGTPGNWRAASSDQFEVKLKVTPSKDLQYTATTADGTFNKATGIWDIGRLTTVSDKQLNVIVTGRDASAAAAADQCLTVEIAHVIPDLEVSRVPVTACMAHKALLLAGDSDLLTMYDCVTRTTYPCHSQPSLELVAVKSAYGLEGVDRTLRGAYAVHHVHRGRFRSDDFDVSGTNTMVLQPEEVVVQVPYLRRHQVRGGTEGDLRWRSPLTYLAPVTRGGADDWRPLTLEVSDVSPTTHGPGSMQLMIARTTRTTDFAVLDYPDVRPSRTYSNGLGDEYTKAYHQFEAMGTYRLQYTVKATKTVSSTATEYTDSATYTFHVGPVAELEVRDAGPNPAVAGNRRAYTIAAFNQGPDTAPAVEVALTGAPEGARVVASRGSYDPDTGIWRIGEMETVGSREYTGQSDAETLTIISEGGVHAPITATIRNTQDYSVCIDGDGNDVAASSESACEAGGNTWHTAEYYDYLDHNNMATIAARSGTGQGHPDAPSSLRVNKYDAIALLRWQPVERVNGWPVTHYQVERNGVMLADNVGGVMYADLRGGTVNQAYRVRAVNEFGVPGPWSLAAGASGPLEQPGQLGAPTGFTATPSVGGGRIDLSWFAPSTETGLQYRIDHATDGAGPWRRLISQSGTTYSHSGLLSGTTHYYRVAAVKDRRISPWAYVQATTGIVGDGAVYVPLWPENLRFTSQDRTAVTLAWDPPFNDGGSRVTGYEYRVQGPCASGSDAVCDIVAPTRVSGTSRRISGLNREGMYEFWVRALNAVGASEWSQAIQKEVGPATASSWRVVLSPSRLTVREGGQSTYRVRLSRDPKLPVAVFLHWIGDDDLGGNLPTQQGQILIPRGYDLSKLTEDCNGYYHQDPDRAYAWNSGVPITVTAAEDDDSENGSLTIRHDIATVPESCFKTPPGNYDSQSHEVYDLAIEVTERDKD